jgi:cysteine desulfurase
VSGVRRVYCDHAATTPVHPDVVAAMSAAPWGNPSSLHAEGREARAALETARREVAALIGAQPQEIIFTSGGTEADNLAILGAGGRGHVICSAVEHHAVLDACRAHGRFTLVPVDRRGRVDPEDVRRALRPETTLVSVMLANNEVGTIQPVAEIAAVCRAAGVLLHTDAVQALGKIPVDVRALGADLLTLSAHKIYGPKGVGALYVRRGVEMDPRGHGGSQERRWRPGTENLPGIVGFGRAAALARRELAERAAHLRSLAGRLAAQVDFGTPTGDPVDRLPGLASYVFPGLDGQALLAALDLAGVAAASGSACTSGAPEPSHVLTAMGFAAEDALTAVRLSFGRSTTAADVDYVADTLRATVVRLRGKRAARAGV